MASTTGMNQVTARSAIRCTGGLDPCASSTRRMIWARTVSFPTRVARNRITPFWFTVPPTTCIPFRFRTGRDSPEIMDSSTEDSPSSTSPSTGTFSPGFTTSTSPAWTSGRGTSTSRSSRTMVAVFGARATSFRMASEVRPLALASRYRPSMRNAASMRAVS
jgi:hypothetical protein